MPELDETVPPACRRIQALAERDPRRAVVLARRALHSLSSANLASRAWARFTLGWALLCWERFDIASGQLVRARESFDALGLEVPALRCSFALAVVGVLQSAQPDLDRDLAALAARFSSAGLAPEAARCQLYRAILFNILGRAGDAEHIIAQIHPAMMEAGELDYARLLRVRAVCAIARGDIAQAIDQLHQAEARFASAHLPLEVTKCWFQHAWALLCQENLEAALAYYERAERVFARLDLPQRMAWCAKNIGFLCTRSGRYDIALQRLLRAIELFRDLGSPIDVAGCQLNIGNLYFYTGLYDAALAYYARAEAHFARAGSAGELLVTRRNQAIIARLQGRSAEAARLLADLEQQAKASGYQAELAAIWHEQAELLASQGRYGEAMARYEQGRQRFAEIDNRLGAADCAMEQGWLALRGGNVDAAHSHFASAEPLLVDHPYTQWQNTYGLARCAEMRGEGEAALRLYRTALTIVSNLRQRLASEATSSGIYGQALQLHLHALRLAAAEGAAELAVEIGEWQRALALKRRLAMPAGELPPAYQDRHNQLRATIQNLLARDPAEPDLASALDAALASYGELLLHARHSSPARPDGEAELEQVPFDLARLRHVLCGAYGSEWTVLVYIPAGPELLIVAVAADKLLLARTAQDAELQRLMTRAVQPAYRRYTYRDLPYLQGQAATRWETLGDLGERLLPPEVRRRLHPDHRLLIVPAGPLHQLPWAALRLGDAWLAQQAIVEVAPSLATWCLLAERRPEDMRALLVGCASFGERAPALLNVDAELAAIAEQWPAPVEHLRDRQATRAGLLARSAHGDLARCALLHFATHARMLPEQGLAAHVKLCDDDVLLAEIASLRLAGCLVVLSACEGAAVEWLPGEEILSLSWAFLIAGASGVVASLWRVEDASAHRFMRLFYAQLRTTGDPAVALAHAQRAHISAGGLEDAAGASPECWASFLLTGPGRLFA